MNDNYCGIKIAHSIENALKNITKCSRCGSMSEHEICEFCLDESRDKTKLCIVQSAKDIFVIEDSNQFDGKYFVIEELDLDILDFLSQIEKIALSVDIRKPHQFAVVVHPAEVNVTRIRFTKTKVITAREYDIVPLDVLAD